VRYTDDEYAEIEVRSFPGAYGGSGWRARPLYAGNGYILLGAFVSLLMPIVVGIPLVVVACWRVARHKYRAGLGLVIALASVGFGLLLVSGTGIPLL
jgi:hypothetical protein